MKQGDSEALPFPRLVQGVSDRVGRLHGPGHPQHDHVVRGVVDLRDGKLPGRYEPRVLEDKSVQEPPVETGTVDACVRLLIMGWLSY